MVKGPFKKYVYSEGGGGGGGGESKFAKKWTKGKKEEGGMLNTNFCSVKKINNKQQVLKSENHWSHPRKSYVSDHTNVRRTKIDKYFRRLAFSLM